MSKKNVVIASRDTSFKIKMIPIVPTPTPEPTPTPTPCTYNATCEVSGFNNPVWDYTEGSNVATLNMEPYPSYGVANIVINVGYCTFTVNINLEGTAC